MVEYPLKVVQFVEQPRTWMHMHGRAVPAHCSKGGPGAAGHVVEAPLAQRPHNRLGHIRLIGPYCATSPAACKYCRCGRLKQMLEFLANLGSRRQGPVVNVVLPASLSRPIRTAKLAVNVQQRHRVAPAGPELPVPVVCIK